MMSPKLLLLPAALLAAGVALTSPASAEDTNSRQRLQCINLMSMGDTPIINDHTILVKMKFGKPNYKRIDLMAPCPDIGWKGFTHNAESYNELCTSDPLIVNAVPGETCMIKQIVDISDSEAKDLITQSHHK